MKIIQNWHFFSNKYHINLFVLFAVLCLGNLEIKAQFTFNPTDFIVVDNTIKPYAVPGTNYCHLDSTRYRLTKGHILHGSNQQYISVALWHNKKINLQDNSFLFTCYLNFDNLVGGADGLAFVLHNIEPYDNLIGEDGGFLGYGHTTTTTNTNSVVAPQIISPSFAIEFDTYSEAADPYDGEAYDCNAYQHINYLQDANMYSGCSVAPVGNLKDGLDHCVNIFWKQTNGVDGSSGYDMITYMDGVMYMSKHYASVSDLVDGATDSVTFGITAACGMKTNTQQVEFIELRNGKNIADTVGLIRIGDIWRHAYNSIPDTNNLAQIGHYWEYIPMYSNVIETTCGTISLNNSLFGVDTVHFGKNLAPFCYNQTKQIKIYLETELDMSNAQWSLKKNDTFEIVAVGTKHLYVDSLLDIVNMSDNRIDTLLVRLVVDNDTLYFSIPYYNDYLDDYYFGLAEGNATDNINYYDRKFIVTLDNSSLEQIIPLPVLSDSSCNYSVESDSTLFSDKPKIIDGSLHFKLLDTCMKNDAEILLTMNCEPCSEYLTINVKNNECMDTVGCGEIELIFDPAPPLTLAGDTNISNIILAGTGSVNSSSSFSRVLVNSEQLIKSINVSTTDTNLASTNIVIDNNTGTIDLSFLCPSKPLFSTNFYGQSCRTNLEVCVTLENGSYCCDTTEVYYICNMIKYVKIFPNPDLGNDILNIYYELYDLPTMPIPLNITIYAQDGNKKMDIMTTPPVVISDTLSVNVNSLQAGIYYVVFQFGNQIETLKYIKQ